MAKKRGPRPEPTGKWIPDYEKLFAGKAAPILRVIANTYGVGMDERGREHLWFISIIAGMLYIMEHGEAPPDILANGEGEKRLPTIDELAGCDPDFTGGLSSEEYIRRMRDED